MAADGGYSTWPDADELQPGRRAQGGRRWALAAVSASFAALAVCTLARTHPGPQAGRATRAGAAVCTEDSIRHTAQAFFSACEAGKGWSAAQAYVVSDSSPFNAQVTDSLPGPKLSEVTTVKGYTDWMTGVIGEFGSKATVDVKASAVDTGRHAAVFYAVFMGFSDYVYALDFDDETCRISRMVKIWNDGYAAENAPGAAKAVQVRSQQTVVHTCNPQTMQNNAQAFFDACEAGKGWNGTQKYVSSDTAAFNAEVTDSLPGPKLTDIKTVKGYSNWMIGVHEEFSKATVYLKASAVDTERQVVVLYAVMVGSDYVYALEFDECKISGMHKIWNDGYIAAALAPA